ncbi:hypothetical protein D3C75_1142160 [compost metagenome]
MGSRIAVAFAHGDEMYNISGMMVSPAEAWGVGVLGFAPAAGKQGACGTATDEHRTKAE